jgi:7-cyano-7-deazaguanine synthase
MTPRNRAGVLASGGVDSMALVLDSLRRYKQVQPIYVRCGLRWEKAEQHWLGRFLKTVHRPGLLPLATLRLPTATIYAGHWSRGRAPVPDASSDDRRVCLPGRNILLLSLAGVYCAQHSLGTLRIGLLKGNPFPDGDRRFLEHMQTTLRTGLNFPLRLEAPFRRLTKSRVLARTGAGPWRLAFSCLNPQGTKPCGRCNKCAEKARALPKP